MSGAPATLRGPRGAALGGEQEPFLKRRLHVSSAVYCCCVRRGALGSSSARTLVYNNTNEWHSGLPLWPSQERSRAQRCCKSFFFFVCFVFGLSAADGRVGAASLSRRPHAPLERHLPSNTKTNTTPAQRQASKAPLPRLLPCAAVQRLAQRDTASASRA